MKGESPDDSGLSRYWLGEWYRHLLDAEFLLGLFQ